MTTLRILFLFMGMCTISLSKSVDVMTDMGCQTFLDSYDRAAMYSRNFIMGISNTWPGGRVPYRISSSFTASQKGIIEYAMKTIENKTCIRFVPRNGSESYVDIFTNGRGCYSNIGYSSHRRRHVLHLQRPTGSSRGTCIIQRIVTHELGHALGAAHEQNRPDRGDFVKIFWANIRRGAVSQFWRAQGEDDFFTPYCGHVGSSWYDDCQAGYQTETYGLGYEYGSNMHYSLYAFSKNGRPTMKTLKHVPSGLRIGRTYFSEMDAKKLRVAYKCQ